jgi:flavin-dependent dehydrogenase
MRFFLHTTLLSMLCLSSARGGDDFEIVIYGGTSGGIAAGIQAARMGKSVVIIEPTRFLGGLTTGGLGATDIGNKRCIGGISREFYQRVWKHYSASQAWTHGTREAYLAGKHFDNSATENAMWTFEPHVATKIYDDMIREANVPVVFNERLDLKNGTVKKDTTLTAIRMESGRTFTGRMFIDASRRLVSRRPRGQCHLWRDAQRRSSRAGHEAPVHTSTRSLCEARRSEKWPASRHSERGSR